MAIRIPVVFLFILSGLSAFSQGIKGRLTDSGNNPVPYAAVYDETTSAGTTSNAEGFYELKLEPGKHSVVYKALGYYLVRRQFTTSLEYIEADILLKEQAVELKAVVVKPGKEDPAYAIMRKVIARAPYHLNMVREYKAEVYLRGTIHIINIPKFIAKRAEIDGKKNVLKNGDVFLQESINQLTFQAPDNYEQKVVSYHSTFPGEGNEVNPMDIIRTSFYEPEMVNIVSPLAPNAFNFYTYHYEGFFNEGEQVIFKIGVKPKHNSQQLMKGTLYVIDKLWCLHSADVSQEMFFGTLSYKTLFSQVKHNAWLPISYQFNVDAAIMGIKANYKYSSSVKFSEVILNEKKPEIVAKTGEATVKNTPPPQSKSDIKKQKNQAEIEKLLGKEELTNRDMVKLSTLMAKAPADTAASGSLEIRDPVQKVTIEKDALKRDTGYWNTIRPVPLTKIEAQLPGMRDTSKIAVHDTISVNDTTKSDKAKKFPSRLMHFLTGQKGFWAFDSTLHVRYNGLIGFKKFDFNTVDGVIFRQTFNLEQKVDSTHKLRIDPGIAYAFSREKIMWWTDFRYDYAPMMGGNVLFHIGSESADYNEETGMNTTINSLASLFFRRNYLKLYQQNQAFITNKIDLANGLNLSATLGYRTAMPLDNHSDYSLFYQAEREYTPNIPGSNPENDARNIYNEEAYWDVKVEYTPRYYYKVWGGKKHYQHSEYPTFFIRNRMAVPGIAKSTADYDLLELGASHRKEWGMMHVFAWNLKTGFFLNRNRVFLMDDKYFNNQDLPVNIGNQYDAFRLVPFYGNSTYDQYAEAHVRFTTPYLLIKYLPFLSKKIWTENLQLNYLTTSEQHHYWEIGYSINQIYMMLQVGIYTGFTGTSFQSYGVQVLFDL
jgi:hypothetical protein